MKRITMLFLVTLFSFVGYSQIANVTIGTGTDESQSVPFEPFYGYTYSQSIYLASEINSSGNISVIKWYYSGTSDLSNCQDLTIYMGHTTKTEFTSTTDWEPVAGLTNVYTGGITVTAGTAGWATITLTTPFAYNGTDNLVIAVDENMSGYNSYTDDFHCTSVTGNRSIYYRDDSTNPDPANPPAGVLAAYIPNVILDTPSCINPITLAVSNITATSADISWADSTGTQSDYEYVVQAAGTGAPAAANGSGTDISATTANVTTLTANTNYEVYVRAECSATDFSDWVGPVNFVTLCVTATAPYTYDVETATATSNSSIGDCWSSDPAGTSSAFRWNVTDSGTTASSNTGPASAHSGTNYFYTEASGGATGDVAQLYSPMVDVSALTTPALQFYYHMYGSTMGELHIDVYNGTTWTNDVETITGQQQTGGSEAWLSKIVNLSSYSGVIQVRFRAIRGTDYYGDMALDNITFLEAPSCLPLTNLAVANVMATSADISWTDTTGTQFDYEYIVQAAGTGMPAAANGTGTDISATTTNVTTLTPNTNYEVYVRAECSTTDFSDWTGPVTFKTLCVNATAPYTYGVETATVTTNSSIEDCWSSTPTGTTSAFRWNVNTGGTASSNTGPSGAYAGSNYFYSEASSGVAGDVAELYSPMIDVTALTAPSLQFYYHMYGSQIGELHIDVYNGTTWTNDVETITGQQQTSDTDAWLLKIVNLSSYSGTIQIRFRAIKGGGYYGDIALDDIAVVEGPTCLPPTTLTATNVMATSADLGWTEQGSATAWNIEYGAPGFTQGSGTTVAATTNPHNLTALTSGTTYDFYVQADCGGGDTSVWVGPLSFTTLCTPYTVTYTQNFDGETAPEVNTCWTTTIVGATSTLANVQTSTTVSNSASNAVRFYNAADASGAYYLISPNFSDLDNTKQIKFMTYKNFGSDTEGDVIEVGVMTDPSDMSTYTTFHTYAPSDFDEDAWKQVVLDFTSYTGGAGHIAFKYTPGTGTYNYFYIDDFVYELAPTTPPVCAANVMATPHATCGNFATALSWDAVATAAGYYLTIGTTSGGNDVLNNQDLGTSLTYSHMGDLNTTYYFTVTPYNASGNAPSCTEVSYATNANGCYCDPTYATGPSSGDLISNVEITGTTLANNSGTATTGPAYTYYTGQPNYTADLQAGGTYDVVVTVGSFGNQNVAVWIDYNDNYIFEPSERVGYTTSSIASAGTATFSISLDCNAPLGVHRMRVRDVYNTTGSNIDPCASYGWGETEDYDITITTAVTCPQPTNLSVANATSTSVDLTWDIGCSETMWNIEWGATGFTQGSGTGTAVTGTTTNPHNLTGLTAVTTYDFYVQADCGGGDTSGWVGPFTFTTPPANDGCDNAIALTVNADYNCGTTTSGTTVGATDSGIESSQGLSVTGTPNNDVWFSFTATQVAHRVSLDNVTAVVGTATDMGMAVFDATAGTCAALSLVADSDPNTLDLTGLTVGNMYYVAVYGWSSAVTTAQTTFDICVGTDPALTTNTFNSSTFVAYPNPVHNVLNLEYNTAITNIRVINLLGQEVINQNVNTTNAQIDMSRLNAGTYMVNVTIDDIVKTIKVIKK